MKKGRHNLNKPNHMHYEYPNHTKDILQHFYKDIEHEKALGRDDLSMHLIYPLKEATEK